MGTLEIVICLVLFVGVIVNVTNLDNYDNKDMITVNVLCLIACLVGLCLVVGYSTNKNHVVVLEKQLIALGAEPLNPFQYNHRPSKREKIND